jgi:hypothetical protein
MDVTTVLTEEYFQKYNELGTIVAVARHYGKSSKEVSNHLKHYLPYQLAKEKKRLRLDRTPLNATHPKAEVYFQKFIELGSLVAVGNYFGVTRQNVEQYLRKYPPYQEYKRNPPPTEPCPRCKSDRTKANGKAEKVYQHATHKFKCLDCQYAWRR